MWFAIAIANLVAGLVVYQQGDAAGAMGFYIAANVWFAAYIYGSKRHAP